MTKQKILQVNKQVVKQSTSLKVNCCCGRPKRKVYKKKRPVKRPVRKLVTDEICGNIEQACNGEYTLYWESIGVLPSGSVRISNDSTCTMEAVIDLGEEGIVPIMKIVEPNQQISVTVNKLRSLKIKCTGEGKHCRGTYAMRLHYKSA